MNKDTSQYLDTYIDKDLGHLLDTYIDKDNYDYSTASLINKKLKAIEIIKKYFYGNGVLFGEMTQEELHFIREVLNS